MNGPKQGIKKVDERPRNYCVFLDLYFNALSNFSCSAWLKLNNFPLSNPPLLLLIGSRVVLLFTTMLVQSYIHPRIHSFWLSRPQRRIKKKQKKKKRRKLLDFYSQKRNVQLKNSNRHAKHIYLPLICAFHHHSDFALSDLSKFYGLSWRKPRIRSWQMD